MATERADASTRGLGRPGAARAERSRRNERVLKHAVPNLYRDQRRGCGICSAASRRRDAGRKAARSPSPASSASGSGRCRGASTGSTCRADTRDGGARRCWCMIHGCKQTATELAQGTRITALADAQRCAGADAGPERHGANPYRCWNWFDARTVAGKGEAAIVAKMIRDVAEAGAPIPRGSSLRACRQAQRSPRFWASAIRNSFARSPRIPASHAARPRRRYTVLTVMKRGPETDVAKIAHDARAIGGTLGPAARDPWRGRRCRRTPPCRGARAAVSRAQRRRRAGR